MRSSFLLLLPCFAVTLAACPADCDDCPQPSGWTVVEWAGSCCYRASPCLSETDEQALYSACHAQDPDHALAVLCGGDTAPEGCIPLAGTPPQQCGVEGAFTAHCCAQVLP